MMRRVIRWMAAVLVLAMAVPILGIASIWGYYRWTVSAAPGGLDAPYTSSGFFDSRHPIRPAPPELPPLGTYAARVDPFIATGGVPWMGGYATPAACAPFGMVRAGPDTASILIGEPALNPSGYNYGDNMIIGFSHTRLVGADAEEGGLFCVTPSRSAYDGRVRPLRFSHAHETARPGFYAVRAGGINVELSASDRAAFHRYAFGRGEEGRLYFDATSALGKRRCSEGEVKVTPREGWIEVEGRARHAGSFSGRYGGIDAYFYAEVGADAFTTWEDGAGMTGLIRAKGRDIGIDFAARAGGNGVTAIDLSLGLSYVSAANARANLEAARVERGDRPAAAVAAEAWERVLARIKVEGGTAARQRIFYSALYRAFQLPTLFTDVNGEYRGFDGQVHKAEAWTYYSDFSLWDTFRTVHPLYNLIARAEQRDFMRSLVSMAELGGALPRWPSGIGYTNCMFGTPADVAVSEAYLKGVRDFDIETAYRCMRETGLTGKPAGTKFAGREDLDDYLEYGYIPGDLGAESVAATLEYAWCDHAIAQLATALGRTEDAAHFAKQSKSYRNLWNPAREFFMPRDSKGAFTEKFDPLKLTYVDFDREYTRAYVEGSAMQWRWSVPFDPEGLAALFPSRERFVEELDRYFENARPVGVWNPGGYYWHGNEPFINAAYLFNAAGRPDLTQKWVRWILDHEYADTYYGLDGNDDAGTLSAWYVFSALGFYPIAGTTRYELGAPLFARATLELGDGKTLTVTTENYAPDNAYAHRVLLDGVPIEGTSFDHAAIANGATLHFVMASAPAR